MTNYCLIQEKKITGPKTFKCNNIEYNVSLYEWLGLRSWFSVKNLGVLFVLFISSICKTMIVRIRNITKLQCQIAKKLIHASMTSRLDYCINVWMSCMFY